MNGAIGTVQDVVLDPYTGDVVRIEVLLDGDQKATMIDKVTVYFPVSQKQRATGQRVGIKRQQFPLQLAYGVTVGAAFELRVEICRFICNML